MSDSRRRHPRQRVHLSVRFQRARDFVQQYAENLSAGGVFVAGDFDLPMHEEVTLEIELPGHGAYTVHGIVAHLIRPGQAVKGRGAGIGIEIREGPPGFKDALAAYLARLGHRAMKIVLVSIEPWREIVADAGYGVWPLPHPQGLVSVIAMCEQPIAGIVVPQGLESLYASALAFIGRDSSSVIPVDPDDEADPVVARLDESLL
jgi:Tfp pilus assembly protein PilZ